MDYNTIEYIFLMFILFLGIVTSYEDIREGKIRNKHIILALTLAVIMNLVAIMDSWQRGIDINPGYYSNLILNVVITLLAGFALWRFNLWTPGDAKLFMAYSALVPLSIYHHGQVSYFPSFTIFSNTFILTMFLILINRLIRGAIFLPAAIFSRDIVGNIKSFKNSIIKCIADIVNSGKIHEKGIFILGFSWILDLIFSFFDVQLTFLMYLVLFTVIPYIFKKIDIISLNRISFILSILRLLLDFNTVFDPVFMKFFILMLAVFTIVKYFLENYGFQSTTKEINIDELKTGMILGERIIKVDEVYKKDRSMDNPPEKEEIIKANNELDTEQIELMQGLVRDKKLDGNMIRIHETLPFAPFLFFGVLVTYFCRGDVVVYLKMLL